MFSHVPSMFQEFQKNDGIKVDFTSFSTIQKEAQSKIRDIGKDIFEKFGCEKKFDDDCIEKFKEIYDAKNFTFNLVNFQPVGLVFSFLKDLNLTNFNNFKQDSSFKTNSEGSFSGLDICYHFAVFHNSKLFKNKIYLSYNENYELASLNYQRITLDQEMLVNVKKTRDMLCPLEDESNFIELFLHDHYEELKDIFPEWYAHNAVIFENSYFKERMEVFRMLFI